MKRRVAGLSRLDRDVVHLDDGPVLVRILRFRDAPHAVKTLRERGRLDRATLEKVADLEAPVFPFQRSLFATLEHDLTVIASPPLRAIAREHRRAFARYDGLDREWLDEKSARLAVLRSTTAPERWTDAIVELVHAMRGEEEARRAANTFATLDAEPMERRARALERVLAIVRAMETHEAPQDPEVAALYERLDAAREWPGRARRRRTLDVLRRAIGWTDLPSELLGDDFVESARRAVALWPIVRDEQTIERFATLVLLFRIGSDGVPSLADIVAKDVVPLREHDLTLDRAIGLHRVAKDNGHHTRKVLARLVAAGLDLELLRSAGGKKQLDRVASLEDVRSARAFITWSARLKDHYAKHGLELNLSPELFLRLPKNEDLAVLTHCLLDHHAAPTADPIGTFDATLGLFQRLPARASALLQELRRAPPGEGRRLDPAFAAWVADDALLDRSIHIARVSGEPPISAPIREDFDRTARLNGERDHLLSLSTRTLAQQARLDALLAPAEAARRDRTLRRLRGRIERLLPTAYRRGLDQTFRRLLREGWGIRLARLTDAWREAVRFWLTVDDNREHLEKLLREAALRPGSSVKDAFPRNLAWLRTMKERFDVDAWMAPRRREIERGFVLELEEDPLEVMRMGIPFGTCLSLEDGSNAASTVLNAIEANKRVLYVRNEAGKIVARKLLGVTDDAKLVGYRLYRSVGGEEERAIVNGVTAFCEELARDCRLPLTGTGSPRRLHKGFWYDDGEVPFEGPNGALPRFCAAHGLPSPPPELDSDDTLVAEAEAWLARETDDVEQALRVLEGSTDSPAMRVHDAWTVQKIGLRRAIRVATNDTTVAFALFHTLAADEPGLLVALEAASRLPESHSDCRLLPVVRRFPSSPKISVALVDLALRAMKHERSRHENERGHVHITLDELPGRFEDVASSLDLLDAIEPAWRWLAQRVKECAGCVSSAIRRAASMIEEIYERAPEPDVIVSALMSRRRGLYAHRAALRVAACHVLPGGERALRRFFVLRPELMNEPETLAARLRQSNGAIERIEPVAETGEPPFWALRDLVALPDVHRFLGRWDTLEGEPKTVWEAAWRRRRRHDPPGGYDAVEVEAARKKLIDPTTPRAERDAARTLIFAAKDNEVVDWMRLVRTCAGIGDGTTARCALEQMVLPLKPVPLSPRTCVDLWQLGEGDVVVKVFEKTYRDEWSGRVQAVEREGASRGVDMSGLLEAVALELAKMSSPSDVVTPNTKAQLERVLGAIVAKSEPMHVANCWVHLEDALSVLTFRDALKAQPAARVAAIKQEIGKLETSSVRSKTFLSWIRDIGGIETA